MEKHTPIPWLVERPDDLTIVKGDRRIGTISWSAGPKNDGVNKAAEHARRKALKEERQVFPNDENPMDEAISKGVKIVFIILLSLVLAAALGSVTGFIRILYLIF